MIHQLIIRLLQHIFLAGSATLIAIFIGVPLGILVKRYATLRAPMLTLINIFQTIPSLALLALLIPLFGIGTLPTLIALTLYALLPITRNAYTALLSLNINTLEAADGLGFSRWQRLKWVELPLALPIIIAGIRTASVSTIGIATIAAFIGAGGLGDFITQGLALNNVTLILLGAIPAALLALLVDVLFIMIERHFARHLYPKQMPWVKTCLAIIIACFVILSVQHLIKHHPKKQGTIIVSSKNFTEQFILADMMADLLKAHTHLQVIKKLDLGTTTIMTEAMQHGAIDLYPEYTGTAYIAVLHRHHLMSAQKIYQAVNIAYQHRYGFTWLKPFGFSNAQTLCIPQALARAHHINTLSQIAQITPQLSIAAPMAFLKRSDGLPLLKRIYHIHFKTIHEMNPALMYEAIKHHDVNVIECFTTDGRIAAYHLVALKDNKHAYPPYYAAPVIRSRLIQQHPRIRSALSLLAGLINQHTMQQLNKHVNVDHQSPANVAKHFLIEKHLLPVKKH